MDSQPVRLVLWKLQLLAIITAAHSKSALCGVSQEECHGGSNLWISGFIKSLLSSVGLALSIYLTKFFWLNVVSAYVLGITSEFKFTCHKSSFLRDLRNYLSSFCKDRRRNQPCKDKCLIWGSELE